MKAFVITMHGTKESVQAADRCIASARKWIGNVEKFDAITPEDDPEAIFKKKGLPTDAFEFDERYSRKLRCMSAFLSHRAIWEWSVNNKTPVMIFEHDAYVIDHITPTYNYDIVSYGKPSYGKFNIPDTLGFAPLQSKEYFPGAHAYYLSVRGAQRALDMSLEQASPTDIFFHVGRFPDIKEYYPWPVEARDHFSTIQKETGCYAKHSYGPGYDLV